MKNIILEKLKKTFQNIIDGNNRKLAIEQIIDFLHDYFNKKLFVLCNDFVPVKADEIGNGYVEVTTGPTEKLEIEMKQLSNFKNFLIVDAEIEKLILNYEDVLQNKLVEIFEKELKNCEDKYNNYFISVCNCIADNFLISFKKLQTHLSFIKLDMAAKISHLKTKYEKKLFTDLENSLKNEKIREFACIWEASNKIPKQQFGTTDRILEQVKKHVELYYDKKIADCNDSNSIQELGNIIMNVHHIAKFPESILTKLNAKQNKLQKSLEIFKNEVNSLLNRNDFDTIAYKINTSKGNEKTYIITTSQEYFDQLISTINPQNLNSNDTLLTICFCMQKLGNSLKKDKFETLMQQLNSNLNQLLQQIYRSIEGNEIPQLTSTFEVFVKLCSNLRVVEAIKEIKQKCILKIREYYFAQFNKFNDAQQKANIQIIKGCLTIFCESQKIIEIILSHEGLFSVQSDFIELLKKFKKSKIKRTNRWFLKSENKIFKGSKKE